MINFNKSGSSSYSSGPRGAAVRDSRVTSGSTVRPPANAGPMRQIRVEVSSGRDQNEGSRSS